MIGQRVSHYDIVAKIGAGGMGVVYKARDTKLDRFVALKFLPHNLSDHDEEKRRFVHEARAASILQHNNICTIHAIDDTDDGRMFICMDYYEGELLKERIEGAAEPMAVDDAVDLIRQIAQGLAKAHESNIVHRDLKPANVMITADGVAKILDFGLAKLRGQTKLTKAGTTLGTAAYMSPEQARGEEVDHRTDIFSLGVLFYQMLSGSLPFKGDYEQAVVYAILNEEPEPIAGLRSDLPAGLDVIVQKAMMKKPEERYGRIADFIADLDALQHPTETAASPPRRPSRGLITGAVAAVVFVACLTFYFLRPTGNPSAGAKSIAVLAFQDISPNEDQEYFCDGMAEELINALTKLPGLRVAARTSTFYFKGRDAPLQTIGRELNVATVLSGSVRKSGKKLRIAAQLVNVADGFQLWSETYDKELADVFAIQEDISRKIISALEAELDLASGEQIVEQHTENEAAYNLFLQGRYFWNRRSEEGLRRSIALFNQAIALDPAYASAYAGLADAYNQMGDYVVPAAQAYPHAMEAAQKALAIDPDLAEAHSSLAYVNYCYTWDWPAAEAGFRRAIELNPKYPTAHQWYAEFLASQGRFAEAKAEIRLALALDPLSLIINVVVGVIDYWSRETDAALAQLQRVIEMDSTFSVAYAYLLNIYHSRGVSEEIYRNQRKVAEFRGMSSANLQRLDAAYQSAGIEGVSRFMVEVLKTVARDRYITPFALAAQYMHIGEKDKALDQIEKALDQRAFGITALPTWPGYDELRGEPRFQQYVETLLSQARAASESL